MRPTLEEMQRRIAERRADPNYVNTDPRVVARTEARQLVNKAREIEARSQEGDAEWVTACSTLALAILALDA